MNSRSELLNVNNIDLKTSFRLFQDLSVKTTNYIDELPPINAENMDFDEKFLGGLIQKPNYNHCRFNKTTFNSSNGSYSNLKNCYFGDCYLFNCDFRYSSFKTCKFQYQNGFNIESCNFSFSTLTNCIFDKISFSGTSFRQMIMSNVEFSDCLINVSSFEHTKFYNCTFNNIDFRNAGIRYCEFKNCKFVNVTFPILDLLSNYGLIDTIKNNISETTISLGSKGTTTFEEAIELLCNLVPYYENVHQYFELINLCILYGELDISSDLIPEALNYVINQNDFEGLKNICKLIVDLKHNSTSERLSNVDLYDIYNLIISLIDPEKLPHNLYKSYIDYISSIRLLLIDNPNNNPTGQIVLKTNILPGETNDLSELVETIDDMIRDAVSKSSPNIQITHNSPYEIIVGFVGALPEILQVCQIFYYTFGGIKALKDIAKSVHEKATNTHKAPKNTSINLKKGLNFSCPIFRIESLFNFEMKIESVEYFVTK